MIYVYKKMKKYSKDVKNIKKYSEDAKKIKKYSKVIKRDTNEQTGNANFPYNEISNLWPEKFGLLIKTIKKFEEAMKHVIAAN